MTKQELQPHLRTRRFGQTVVTLDSVDSTNTLAKSLAADGRKEGTLVIAEEQTHGRGRLGRSWHSERGMNLTFSVILQPSLSVESLGLVSLFAAVAVARGVTSTVAPLTPVCKWPNDVQLEGKKICGILSEASLSGNRPGAVVVGIGINVNERDFPPEIAGSATSLLLATGRFIDRPRLLADVLLEMENLYRSLNNERWKSMTAIWKKHSAIIGKQISVKVDGTIIRGIAEDVTENGSLVVRSDDRRLTVVAGDVTILS